MASESTQKWVGRNRPPRVHITYDVETGGAIEKRELPFVVGVLADLTPENTERAPLRQSRFVEIDRDNFNKVMENFGPKVKFAVDNKLDPAKAKLAVEFEFKGIDDFDPLNVIDAVPELSALLHARRALVDLETKLYGNDNLEKVLRRLAEDPKLLGDIKTSLGLEAPQPQPQA
jgi:type VI secretion system protein ImpB